MEAIYKRIRPQMKKYNVYQTMEVLEEILMDAEEEGKQLSDAEIIELVVDIMENDPPQY
jgi:hypothetical protein